MLMHSAPCTKHSVSMPQCFVMCSTSGRLSSRASTTRVKPSSFSSSAPCRVWTLIWVEPWRGSCGAIFPIRVATARSWQITASAPLAATDRMACSRAGSSVPYTVVFSATCTATPRAWQNRTASFRLSASKLPAPVRALKPEKPR